MGLKKALITGITGQDGAYLTQYLIEQGYQVHGLVRRSSVPNTHRLIPYLQKVSLHYGDLTDGGNLIRLLSEIEPDEIYNLGAQSHVGLSFDMPEYTGNTDGLGTLRLLEAIRILSMEKTVRFYQASSSELFGNTKIHPQNENTPFEPCSPYGTAKLFAYWSVSNYRAAYGLHASNGILFNHESPLRGEEFVTRKVTKAVAAHYQNRNLILELGNLDAKRDWGHAKDYIRGMHMMLQQDSPDDYVLATGRSENIRWLVEEAFSNIDIGIDWEGEGLEETGRNSKTNDIVIRINPDFYRPTDVSFLQGDASKAKAILGWEPQISLEDMIKEMVESDLKAMSKSY